MRLKWTKQIHCLSQLIMFLSIIPAFNVLTMQLSLLSRFCCVCVKYAVLFVYIINQYLHFNLRIHVLDLNLWFYYLMIIILLPDESNIGKQYKKAWWRCWKKSHENYATKRSTETRHILNTYFYCIIMLTYSFNKWIRPEIKLKENI